MNLVAWGILVRALIRFAGRSLLRIAPCIPLLTWSQAAAKEAKPPNVVVILSDDQAWTDYGFMGHSVIHTPHLDQLARRSLIFERGYVASPLCRPSLASIATGLHPFQHGITGNDVDGTRNRAELDLPVRRAFHQHPTFIKLLASHGYLAHQSGKWWEGSFQEGGFTHGMTHGDPARNGRHGDEGLTIGRQGIAPIKDFIDHASSANQPFLLWYAPFLPHVPHDPPARILERYLAPDRPTDQARYFAMCEWFDETCGELLTYLEHKQLSQNTLVIYLCDNGWAATSTNQQDPDQKTWSQYALRSKGSPFENGIRTPILVSWPDRIKPARRSELAHAIDVFPTIAAATGFPAPENLPGINLLDPQSCMKRKTLFGVTHAIHNMKPGHPDATLQYLWCIHGTWKLILRQQGEDTTHYRTVHAWDRVPTRLYDLAKDRQETRNLASTHPKQVEQLRQLIHQWHPPLQE